MAERKSNLSISKNFLNFQQGRYPSKEIDKTFSKGGFIMWKCQILKKGVQGVFTRLLVEPNGLPRIQDPQMFDRSKFEVLL